jgi:hypothetical protein
MDSKPDISQKIQNGRHKKRSGQHTVAPPKNTKKALQVNNDRKLLVYHVYKVSYSLQAFLQSFIFTIELQLISTIATEAFSDDGAHLCSLPPPLPPLKTGVTTV